MRAAGRLLDHAEQHAPHVRENDAAFAQARRPLDLDGVGMVEPLTRVGLIPRQQADAGVAMRIHQPDGFTAIERAWSSTNRRE